MKVTTDVWMNGFKEIGTVYLYEFYEGYSSCFDRFGGMYDCYVYDGYNRCLDGWVQ
jgi:hypothetical protein